MEQENKNKRFLVPGKVKVVNGSILTPHNAGLRFVLNVNNMLGKPESPLYPVLDKKWKKVKEESRGWYANKTGSYKLGAVNSTAVQSDVWVMHLLCQDEELKVSAAALNDCLKKVCELAKSEKATVHVSNILTDYVPEMEASLTKQLVEEGVSVFYYNEP